MESYSTGDDEVGGSRSPVASTSASSSTQPPTGRARSRSQLAAAVAREQALDLQRQQMHDGDVDGRKDSGEITAGELRAEMETLLSLRRRSLSQPASVDPDLPPPTSSPPPQPSSRPSLTVQIPPPPLAESPAGGPVSPTAPAAAETGTLVRRRSSVSTNARLPSDHPLPLPSPPLLSPTGAPATQDGVAAAHTSQDLFWLPASLHPELAPQEFKAFIREQTRPEALARRTSMNAASGGQSSRASSMSLGGGRVDRRKSMLRGEYKPRQGDGVGDSDGEDGARPRLDRTGSSGGRRRSARGGMSFDELTISDLQRLEELAAHAETESAKDGEGEGERLGRVLRRSLSLNPNLVAAAAAGLPLSVSTDQLSDSASTSSDSPIVVHSPGQILRRSARTKIRKVGLPGDGNGHRFGPSRRARAVSGDLSTSTTAGDDGTESDSYDGNRSVDSLDSDDFGGRRSTSPGPSNAVDMPSPSSSPSSSGHETQYFENAPAVAEPDSPTRTTSRPLTDGIWTEEPSVVSEPPSPSGIDLNAPLPPPPVIIEPSAVTAPSPSSPDYDWSTHHSGLLPQTSGSSAPYVAPILAAPIVHAAVPAASVPPPVANLAPAPPRPQQPSPPAKEKKSGWARLGLGSKDDESSKKKNKSSKGGSKEMEKMMEQTARQQQLDRERSEKEQREREEKLNKESTGGGGGFLSGLFGKRKSDHGAGEAPHYAPTPSPPPEPRIVQPPPPTASGALTPSGRYINFYRLPIHVERAVYRLSHIKLANPRRPLYEQVLISNLMFWYLSIINKPVAPPAPPQPAPVPIPRSADDQQSPTSSSPTSDRSTSPRDGSSTKRAGLSKPDSRRGGRASAEYAVKQPQYEQQNRQIDQEYQQKQYQGQRSSAPSSQQAYTPPHSAPPQVVVEHVTSTAPIRSPDRSSAPADMYSQSRRRPRVSNTSSDEDSPPSEATGFDETLHDDDDDRPLGVAQHYAPASVAPPQHRESYPPQRRSPTSPTRSLSGFEPVSPVPAHQGDTSHSRRVSNVSALSERSFDEGEIIDAYGAVSPTLGKDTAISPFGIQPNGQILTPTAVNGVAPPMFGNVAPRKRGESLAHRAGAASENADAGLVDD